VFGVENTEVKRRSDPDPKPGQLLGGDACNDIDARWSHRGHSIRFTGTGSSDHDCASAGGDLVHILSSARHWDLRKGRLVLVSAESRTLAEFERDDGWELA